MNTRSILRPICSSVAITFALLAGCSSDQHTSGGGSAKAARSGAKQLMFDSPQAASAALIDAARRDDQAYLKKMFGPDVDRLKSGDRKQDDIDLQVFVAACDVYADTAQKPDGTYALTVGEQRWVFPAPIVRDGDLWYFDTAAGINEVIARTIGLNELNLIVALDTYVQAQETYFTMDPDGDGTPAYAERFRSTPGTRDGLYWAQENGAPMSPIGPLVASAVESGELDLSNTSMQPYRGYYFRVLTSQGPSASGGAKDYIDEDGRMTRGYALIAWPASYNETGVMSFLVSKGGVVYQRDLGIETAQVVEHISSFDPANGWQPVE